MGTVLGLPRLRGALGQGGEEGARAGKQRVDTDDGGDAHRGRRKRRAAQAGLDKPGASGKPSSSCLTASGSAPRRPAQSQSPWDRSSWRSNLQRMGMQRRVRPVAKHKQVLLLKQEDLNRTGFAIFFGQRGPRYSRKSPGWCSHHLPKPPSHPSSLHGVVPPAASTLRSPGQAGGDGDTHLCSRSPRLCLPGWWTPGSCHTWRSGSRTCARTAGQEQNPVREHPGM